MLDNRYVAFILKIIDMTRSAELNWHYLDENLTLCRGMKWMHEQNPVIPMFDKERPEFDVENSFYAKYNDTSIVLFVWNNEPAKLVIVPSTFKSVLRLEADEYGEHITRLLNLVQSKFPNAEAFVDSIINQS